MPTRREGVPICVSGCECVRLESGGCVGIHQPKKATVFFFWRTRTETAKRLVTCTLITHTNTHTHTYTHKVDKKGGKQWGGGWGQAGALDEIVLFLFFLGFPVRVCVFSFSFLFLLLFFSLRSGAGPCCCARCVPSLHCVVRVRVMVILVRCDRPHSANKCRGHAPRTLSLSCAFVWSALVSLEAEEEGRIERGEEVPRGWLAPVFPCFLKDVEVSSTSGLAWLITSFIHSSPLPPPRKHLHGCTHAYTGMHAHAQTRQHHLTPR